MKYLYKNLWVVLMFGMVACFGSACEPTPRGNAVPDGRIVGEQVVLETVLGKKRLTLRAKEMIASSSFSSVRLQQDASIELESVGRIRCNTVEIAADGKTVSCVGDVQAAFQIPIGQSFPTGGPAESPTGEKK